MTPVGMFVVLSLAAGSPVGSGGFVYERESDADVLQHAERAFTDGTKHRDDAATARPQFGNAARGYDELWRRGVRNPALALARANAHRLAGDLPAAIAAFHDGLAVARYDRALRVGLEAARSAVSYPLTGDLARQCRPPTPATIGTRMSPLEACFVAGSCWLVACVAGVRYAMTRGPGWLVVAGAALTALAVLGGLWAYDWRQALADPRLLLVVTDDATLRRGNGPTYPPRLEPNLPKGVEAREVARRGGWVQVELAGGTVGWLPETAVQ